MLRRLVPIGLIMTILCASTPAPAAAAVSTSSEVDAARDLDKQVTAATPVVTDPLENAWVSEISHRLWAQVVRKDVPYNIKILDANDVNAFSTMGGFVYINEGTLDFAQSDDELAGVIGHETGHIERRHAVTMQSKVNMMNLVFGIASFFSPFVYRFGQLAEAGIVARWSRDDERQADQYGLLLMSRAGYDPEAMVTFMEHLGAAHGEHGSIVDKYFADHPGVPERVTRLQNAPELSATARTPDQELVAALHDEDETRYSIAALDLNSIFAREPENATVQLHLAQAQFALGDTTQSAQNLAAVAANGAAPVRTVAATQMRLVQSTSRRANFAQSDLAPLRAAVTAAQSNENAEEIALASRRESGIDQMKGLNSRVENIGYEVPDFSQISVRKGGRLDAVIHNLSAMSVAVNTALQKSGESLGGVGSIERGKERGLIQESVDIENGLAAALDKTPVPSDWYATFSQYPKVLAMLQNTDADMIRSVDAARGSLALLDTGLGNLDKMLRELLHGHGDFTGDLSVADYNTLVPLMAAAQASLNRAAVAGAQAWQLYNLARARQLEAHITLLGVGSSAGRYATLQHALDHYVKNDGIGYDEMIHDNLSAGEVAAASVIAADTNTTPQAVIAQARETNRPIVDVANARGMRAISLEMFMGLVYLDYTDDPAKELHPPHNGSTT